MKTVQMTCRSKAFRLDFQGLNASGRSGLARPFPIAGVGKAGHRDHGWLTAGVTPYPSPESLLRLRPWPGLPSLTFPGGDLS